MNSCFGSLMDIDKLIHTPLTNRRLCCFGSLMDIDKLIHAHALRAAKNSFGSLMDIDKLIRKAVVYLPLTVLVL